MTELYNPKTLEPAVRERWWITGIDRADDAAEQRYYCLSMFPYPSGKLHMGHVRNYTISDVITRYHRMRGVSVLHPMGWDAFGLPAENAAMKHGVPPAEWTRDNIDYMRTQLKSLGLSIDWDRELATCDPDYYRWNQWLFVRMLEAGIAYKKTGTVNWDPVDQTVLANEQVIDGRGWRTGAEVVKREIPMYYLGITRYAQELLDALDGLDGWPERVRTMQANWIGRSEGVAITFPCQAGDIRVFTTRADTLMGATYLAVAPEHPLAARAAETDPELANFVKACQRGGVSEADIAMLEKKGMDTGITARHPLSGDELPVWVANYVLMGYGEGAVMAVPGHDQRDFEFANKYKLPIRQVVTTGDNPEYDHREWQDWYAVKEGIRLINSGPYDGLDFAAGVEAIGKALEEQGLGKRRVQFRLRDWGISRQRYWGCPIPIIHCETCGDVPVPDEDLPVVLPENLVPDGSGSPLARDEDFIRCQCPRCGQGARRETDTMDTFVDSAWYFMRYACADNDAAMVDERVNAWMPVDQYIGGIEHAILHLLYARFWTKVMRDLGLVAVDEPFRHLLTQGMVLNHIWSRRTEAGGIEYFNPDEVEAETDDHGRVVGGRLIADASPVDYDGMGTMSKSKNNGVDPQSLVDRYGADTVRLFTMFAAPPEQSLEWSDSGVEGAWRFLRRLWQQVDAYAAGGVEPGAQPENPDGQGRELRRKLHTTIGKVSDDIARRYTFNTAIAAIMELVNDLGRFEPDGHDDQALCQEAWETVTRLLAPVAPHIAEGLWARLGYMTSVFAAGWPAVDESALEREAVTIVVQVNGKVRGRVEAAPGCGRSDLERIALADDNVARFVDGKTVRKVVVVPDKLVNIVAQ